MANDIVAFTVKGTPASWTLDLVSHRFKGNLHEYRAVTAIPDQNTNQVKFDLVPQRYPDIPPTMYAPVDGFSVEAEWHLKILRGSVTTLHVWPVGVEFVPRSQFTSQPVVAIDDHVNAFENQAVTIDVLANDYYPATPVLTVPTTDVAGVATSSGTRAGKVAVAANKIVFTPDAGFSGPASFRYHLNDGSTWATVHLSVKQRPSYAKVSFIGGTPTTPQDTPFVNRLKSLGFSVTRLDDSAATVANTKGTLIVISSSVVPDTLRAFAAATREPIVTWEPYIAHEMGLLRRPTTAAGLPAAREDPAPFPELPAALQSTSIAGCCAGVLTEGLGEFIGSHANVIEVLLPPSDPNAPPPLWSGAAWADAAVGTREGDRGDFAVVLHHLLSQRVLLPWTFQTQTRLALEGWTLFDRAVRSTAAPD